jgi:hypothetical protein
MSVSSRSIAIHACQVVLPSCNEHIVLMLRHRVQHVAHRHREAAVARSAANANQIPPLPVQKRQPRRPEHREIELEEATIPVPHVIPANQISECLRQSVIADDRRSLAFFANPAEEEALLLIRVGMLDQARGKSKHLLDEARDRRRRSSA